MKWGSMKRTGGQCSDVTFHCLTLTNSIIASWLEHLKRERMDESAVTRWGRDDYQSVSFVIHSFHDLSPRPVGEVTCAATPSCLVDGMFLGEAVTGTSTVSSRCVAKRKLQRIDLGARGRDVGEFETTRRCGRRYIPKLKCNRRAEEEPDATY